MKLFVLCIVTLSLLSCINQYEEDISNVEFLLGTDLKVKYEIENIETSFDFAEYYISFDLKFTKKDFNLLLKNIDLSKFRKVNFSDLDLQNKFEYYREQIDQKEKVHLFIDTVNNSLRYSSER